MAEIQRNDQTQQQVAEISPQFAFQKAGTVGATEITVNIGSATKSVLISNTHATQSLYVKFRSLKNAWNTDALTIAPSSPFMADIRITAIKIRGSCAGTTYEIMATKE